MNKRLLTLVCVVNFSMLSIKAEQAGGIKDEIIQLCSKFKDKIKISDEQKETLKKSAYIIAILLSSALSLNLWRLNRNLKQDVKDIGKERDGLAHDKKGLEASNDSFEKQIANMHDDHERSKDGLRRLASFLLKLKEFKTSHEEVAKAFDKLQVEWINGVGDTVIPHDINLTTQNLEAMGNKLKEFGVKFNVSDWIAPLSAENNVNKD